MGIGLIRKGSLDRTDDLEKVQYADTAGRQLYTLVRNLSDGDEDWSDTGIYQALADEKHHLTSRVFNTLEAEGTDGILPTQVIPRHFAYGPMAALAITLGCKKSFWTLEAGAFSGMFALNQALRDLHRNRCARALVGSYTLPEHKSWILMLGRQSLDDLCWVIQPEYGHRQSNSDSLARIPAPLQSAVEIKTINRASDTHGMETLGRAMTGAQEGRPTAVWTSDERKRGCLVAFWLKSSASTAEGTDKA